MKAINPKTGPVERSDLVHGYEIKGAVVVDNEDLDHVRLQSTKTLEIEKFVPAEQIDSIYFDEPYFVLPSGKEANEAYGVIREAIRHEKQVGLARLVLAHREHTVAIMPREKGPMAVTLRRPEEMEDEKRLMRKIPAGKPEGNMVAIATKIIGQHSGRFQPDAFQDRYEPALRDLIKAKARGIDLAPVDEPAKTKVVDLMAVLRASIGSNTRRKLSNDGARGEVVRWHRPKGRRINSRRKPARSTRSAR